MEDKELISRAQRAATGANIHELNKLIGCYYYHCSILKGERNDFSGRTREKIEQLKEADERALAKFLINPQMDTKGILKIRKEEGAWA